MACIYPEDNESRTDFTRALAVAIENANEGDYIRVDSVRFIESPKKPVKQQPRHDWWNQNRKY